MDKPIVVLDANAFISAQSLLELGKDHRLITTPNVLDQLRDAKTREMVQNFPFTIEEIQCDKKSLAIVRQFAKKTGDISSLSDVDMELIALAYMLYVQNGKSDQLRKQPSPLKQYINKESEYSEDEEVEVEEEVEEEEEEEGDKNAEGFQQCEDEQQEQQIKEKGEQQTCQQKNQPQCGPNQEQEQKKDNKIDQNTKNQEEEQNEDDGWIFVPQKKKKRVEESDDDIDENEGWVTPQNFEKKMAENTATFEQQSQPIEDPQNSIWLMTADFAMQNVAIQMGMLLKSLDGRKITEVRRFILECYLCWKQYKVEDNKVKLCKQCGYNSLSKIAYSMSGEGKMILHRKKGWKPNQKVLEWKERKYQENQKKKKHQHARRKKQGSIFDV